MPVSRVWEQILLTQVFIPTRETIGCHLRAKLSTDLTSKWRYRPSGDCWMLMLAAVHVISYFSTSEGPVSWSKVCAHMRPNDVSRRFGRMC
jgi:hypothetical protein